MQSVLSRNWTRIAVSISCEDNHYTTGTCKGWYSIKSNLATNLLVRFCRDVVRVFYSHRRLDILDFMQIMVFTWVISSLCMLLYEWKHSSFKYIWSVKSKTWGTNSKNLKCSRQKYHWVNPIVLIKKKRRKKL